MPRVGIVAFTLGTDLAGGIAGGMVFLALAASSRQAVVTPAVSDDYQRRSDPERVLGAIWAVFGSASDQERVTTQSEPRMATRSSSTAIAKSGAPSDLTSPIRTR